MKFSNIDNQNNINVNKSPKTNIEQEKSNQLPSKDNKKNTNNNVSISMDLSVLKEKIKNSSEIDQSKVDSLKEKISSGNYEINSERLASKILKNQIESRY